MGGSVRKLKVLVACERSGIVREAFRKLGHNAWSCDIVPADDGSEYHLQCDVLTVLDNGWDLAIFHPPCQYLCNSGVRWLVAKDGNLITKRFLLMRNACRFFAALYDAPINKVCIENPVMHKHARQYLEALGVPSRSQTVQPWQFGRGETKATCLWLKNLPLLKPTNIVPGREQRIWKLPPSTDRARLRSITYQGIADAFAQQFSI